MAQIRAEVLHSFAPSSQYLLLFHPDCHQRARRSFLPRAWIFTRSGMKFSRPCSFASSSSISLYSMTAFTGICRLIAQVGERCPLRTVSFVSLICLAPWVGVLFPGLFLRDLAPESSWFILFSSGAPLSSRAAAQNRRAWYHSRRSRPRWPCPGRLPWHAPSGL